MHLPTPSSLLIPLLTFSLTITTSAFLTLDDMAEITNLTMEARERIYEDGGYGGYGDSLRLEWVSDRGREEMGERLLDEDGDGEGGDEGEQRVLGAGAGEGEGRREDVEDDVTSSISMINAAILQYLNIPGPPNSFETENPPTCPTIITNYYSFLEKTTLFLRAIEDTQITYRWDGNSPVFDSLGYLQALWASRRPNQQNRSFIEQQIALYSSTGCFPEKGKEVLRRDVEVVEYMNDLLDSFR